MRKRPSDYNHRGLLAVKPEDRILVVAPHADDESIGCGGLLIKYAKQADVLLLSDGRYGLNPAIPDMTPEKVRLLRRDEFRNAMEMLGVRKYTMLDIENGQIYRHYSTVRKYDIREYDLIFVPSRFENNQDHLHARIFLRRMLREQRAKAVLLEYEVWVPIPDPQIICDISDVIDRKKELLGSFESQLKCYDYVNFAYGLNLYRGGRFKRKCVEAFFVQPRHYHLKKILRALTTYGFRQRIKALFRGNRRDPGRP